MEIEKLSEDLKLQIYMDYYVHLNANAFYYYDECYETPKYGQPQLANVRFKTKQVYRNLTFEEFCSCEDKYQNNLKRYCFAFKDRVDKIIKNYKTQMVTI